MQVRLRLRGGRQGAEVPARRQGRQPRRDDEPRPARAARLHDHHRGVQGVHGRRRHAARRPDGRGRRRAATRSRQKMGKRLGDAADPLLVSVRSGAPFSMPGMMDTVLNLGLNDDSVGGPRASRPTTSASRTTRTAGSCRCSARSCSTSPATLFEEALHELRRGAGRRHRHRAVGRRTSRAWSRRSRASCKQEAGVDFPQDPHGAARLRDRGRVQVVERRARARLPPDGEDPRRPRHRRERADDGVRQQGRRLRHRRRVHAQPRHRARTGPTATSSRNAQGEDVVAGIRITEPLDAMAQRLPRVPRRSCSSVMQLLENHYRDMCDIEFTIEQGRLFMLQTRVGKRTAAAALRMAVEMEDEGLIDKREAVLRVAAGAARPAAAPAVRPRRRSTTCSPRASTRRRARPSARCTSPPTTPRRTPSAGEHVILVRPETSPDDLHGMIAAEGILTSRGGLVSHAAVVARGMGKPAVCGADDARDRRRRRKQFTVGDTIVHEGDVISINGTTGEVVVGAVPVDHARADRPRSPPSSAGPTSSARSRCAPTPTCPRTREGARVRRRGHRPVPHRAHVPRRPAADRAAHHPRRRRRRGAAPRSTSCETLQRADFVGHPRGDGRPARHRPAARPAAARVPPRHRGAARQATRKGELDDEGRKLLARGAVVARVEPDARHAWRAGSASSSPACTACRCRRCIEAAVDAQAARAAIRSSRS